MNKPTTWCKSGRVSLVSSSCLYKSQAERALAQVCHTRIDALSLDEYQFHFITSPKFPSPSSNISKVNESLMNLENHGEMFLEPSAWMGGRTAPYHNKDGRIKSEKIKNIWNGLPVWQCLHYDENYISLHIALHQKQKQKQSHFFSCTLKYNFNLITAEEIEMGHHQWNGVLKLYRCMLWHLLVPDHWYSTN